MVRPLLLRAYLASVVLAVLPLALSMAMQSSGAAPGLPWAAVLCVGIALLVSELATVDVVREGHSGATLSVSSCFAIVLVLVAPLWAALLLQAVVLAVESAWNRTQVLHALFNVAQHLLAMMAARAIFCLLTGEPLLHPGELPASYLPAMAFAGLSYLVVNSLLVTVAVTLLTGRPFLAGLRADSRTHCATYALELALVPFAVLAAGYSVFLLPVLLIPVAFAVQATQVAEAREWDATHDRLTGLPNRQLLQRRLTEMSAPAVAGMAPRVLVLAVGVDRFDQIVAALGHDAADELLRAVGGRLSGGVRSDDVVGRLGGEVFAVLCPLSQLPDHQQAEVEQVAERLLKSLRLPFEVSGVRVDIQATAGAAVCPDSGTADQLLQKADTALSAAGEGGRGILHLHDPAAEVSSPAQLSLLGELREALEAGHIEVHFQPKVAALSGVVGGVEALVRWRHPERGLIPPMEFVPLAETTGLIAPLTWEVLDQSLAQSRTWLDRGWLIGMSVNLAAAQLMDAATPGRVLELLTQHGVPSDLLTVEVTEGSLIQDAKKAIEVLGVLRAFGVRVSIDDYGTGYSSLSYLKQLPVDELKIDRAFIKHLADEDNRHDLAIVESTIELGHRLYLSVVAEGVECEAEMEILRDLGCDYIQGYLHSPPKPGPVLTEWLAGREVPMAAPTAAGDVADAGIQAPTAETR